MCARTRKFLLTAQVVVFNMKMTCAPVSVRYSGDVRDAHNVCTCLRQPGVAMFVMFMTCAPVCVSPK